MSFLATDTEAAEVADAETLRRTEPGATPLPFPPRAEPQPSVLQPARRRSPRRAALAAITAAAAAAAASVVFGPAVYQALLGPPKVEVARLLTSLPGKQAAIAKSYWGPVHRGASGGPDDRSLASFRLGVELVNLQASFAVGDRTPAQTAAAHINGFLEGTSAGLDTKLFFKGLPVRIASGAPLASLAGELSKARRDVEGYLEPADYDFGRWAESGRLAAAAAQTDFLTARDTRRFPAALRGLLNHPLKPRAAPALDEIARILDRGELTAEDYQALDARFREILETYYPV